MIIEQQQIITTHNMAQIFEAIDLQTSELKPCLPEMARHCFTQACSMLQAQELKLRHIKNAAYAWRHMVFYLSWLSVAEVDTFLDWAADQLATLKESRNTQHYLLPALRGLGLVAMGQSLHLNTQPREPRPFLGWRCKPKDEH